MMTPLDYARAACDTMMRRYAPEQLPPEGRFHYHQGVFLSGMYQTYLLTSEEKYFDYIKAWVDSVFDAEGKIKHYIHADLDDIIWETENDPNPFPRFTVEILAFFVGVFAVIFLLVKGIKRLLGFRSKKPRHKPIKPISRYYR